MKFIYFENFFALILSEILPIMLKIMSKKTFVMTMLAPVGEL